MQKISNIFVKVMVVIALLLGAFSLGYHAAPKPLPLHVYSTATTVSVMVDAGDTVKTFTDIPYVEGETVFSLLSSLASTSQITLSSKDYGGDLGVFIESIDGVGAGAKDKWWQFWVNNEYSTVGASSYVLAAGDTVVFKFTKSQQK